ncbi:MAG: hypothetical protein J6B70_04975 [Oscillospiraceae bacterium]|nr:hypothetical protein [Oscillospiraceae bacterium]
MKKTISLILCAAMCAALFAGCGKQNAAPSATETIETTEAPAPQYASSLELLDAVWNAFPEDARFPAGGGDEAHDTNGPGAFDVKAYGETFQYLILLDDGLMDKLTGDAATLMHMMNTNTFCSAVMQLQEDEDPAAFAESYKTIVQSNHWMCGFPDTVVVLNLGSFVLTAYGKNDPIQSFKDIAVSLGAQLLVEAPAES